MTTMFGVRVDGLPRRSASLRFLPLLALAAIALAVLSARAAAVAETEPNNAPSSANDMASTGSYVITGTTDAFSDTSDYYGFNLTRAAVVEIVVTSDWDCEGAVCENLSVYTSSGRALLDPIFEEPMSGDDVYFSGLAGEYFFLQVKAGTPGGPYSLKVYVYPFNYTAGERVDISEANESSAVVALAWALPKSSTHPYNLQLEGEGIYYGHTLVLYIANVGPLALTVEIPAGLTWVSEDGLFTNYVVTRTQTVEVAAWSYDDPLFIAAAESPYDWVPGDPSRPNNDPWYFLGPRAAGDLGRVVDECDRGSYSFESEQIAIWAVTAGQSKADFDQLGASTSAYNEAKTLLSRAGVGSAISSSTTRTSSLSWIFTYWPFCFALIFVGLPVIFGLTMAARAVRLASRQIDNAFTVDRTRFRQAADERRAYIREARAREKERARQRREEARAARYDRPPPVPAPVVAVHPPPAVAHGPPSPYERFMKADSHENFDLDELNALDFNAILAEAVVGKETAAATSKKGEELRQRLRQDIADPDTIDDILRNRLLVWYRTSATNPSWSPATVRAWGGLVAASATGGGRRRAALDTRFASLQDACDAKGKWIKPKPRVADPAERRVGPTAESDPAIMKAEVTQAVLDDLAANPKSGDQPFPLPVLSELAARYTPQRVNNALAEMFKAEPRGPFVVLHPSRYADCDVTAIRAPAQGAKAGAMSYDLYFAKTAAAVPGAAVGGFVPSGGPVPGLLDTSSAIWTRDNVPKEEWSAVLAELQRQRQRLDPPPSNYRKLPAYFTLRQLLVADNAARLAFIGTKWRGKPVGLPLLCQLLVDKAFTPEFDTDREYFEAELGDLERGDPNYLSASGNWTIAPGVVVKRSGGETGTFSYSL